MLHDHTLAILGAGNIGQALIGGLLRGEDLPPSQIRATCGTPPSAERLESRFPGVSVGTSNAVAVRGADVVLLAVKPQTAARVLDDIRAEITDQVLLVSILAGVTTRSLAADLGRELPVVRAMPNTPALVDEAATAIAAGRFAEAHHLDLARQVFTAVGEVELVTEDLMDAVTGLSGSGPAYVYMMIEALTDAGVKQGLRRPVALQLSAQTVLGAARLVLETGSHPALLRDAVTTPGGTTIAAVAELEKQGLRTMLIDAVATAAARSAELRRIARADAPDSE